MNNFTFILMLALVGACTTVVSAKTMMDVFRAFSSKKNNNGVLPRELNGVICRRDGKKPRSNICFNKHGARCSSDFLSERIGDSERRRYGKHCKVHKKGKKRKKKKKKKKRCSKGEISDVLCPQPCGCVLDGSPRRESKGIMATKFIIGGCGDPRTWEKVKNVLAEWKVPRETYTDFEMSLLTESSRFAVFDLFIQPEKRKARYGLAIGAGRCHGAKVEIGYMFTGMWQVGTVERYRCQWNAGCSETGISAKNIAKTHRVLEWYAWKQLAAATSRRKLKDASFDLYMEDQEEGLMGANQIMHGYNEEIPEMDEYSDFEDNYELLGAKQIIDGSDEVTPDLYMGDQEELMGANQILHGYNEETPEMDKYSDFQDYYEEEKYKHEFRKLLVHRNRRNRRNLRDRGNFDMDENY